MRLLQPIRNNQLPIAKKVQKFDCYQKKMFEKLYPNSSSGSNVPCTMIRESFRKFCLPWIWYFLESIIFQKINALLQLEFIERSSFAKHKKKFCSNVSHSYCKNINYLNAEFINFCIATMFWVRKCKLDVHIC